MYSPISPAKRQGAVIKKESMKQFISFVIKETRHITRDKRTMLILFGMPVVMMLLFGFAISNDVKNVRTVVVNSTLDHQTERMVTALSTSEYFDILYNVTTPREAEELIRSQKADIAIVFSQNFAGKRGGIQLIADGSDPNMAQQYANYATQIFSQHYMDGLDSNHANTLKINLSTKLLYNPQMKSSYNFVPGIMGMLLMLICAMMTSISIVKEKERGTMEVLLVSPIKPIRIIVAKAIPYLVLAFAILTTILLMSRYILGVPLAGSLFWIILVSGIYIIMALSLGLLISTIANTQLVALLMSAMMLIMPSVLLSGMMFPIESMPVILQWISAVMPPRYYIAAMRSLMIVGAGIDSALPEVLILTFMATLFLCISLLKFKKRLE